MTTEFIRYRVASGQEEQFVQAYAEAGIYLKRSPECLGFEVLRGAEEPERFTVVIRWKSIEQHENGFRKSADFPAFFAAVKPFFAAIEEMETLRSHRQRISGGAMTIDIIAAESLLAAKTQRSSGFIGAILPRRGQAHNSQCLPKNRAVCAGVITRSVRQTWPMFLLVHLWAKPDQIAALRAYEDAALDIFRQHGGQIHQILRPDAALCAPDSPDEVHLLSIALMAQWDTFRGSQEIAALKNQRDSCIARTRVFFCSAL